MLRVVQSTNPSQARHYYSKADYYSEGQELVGTWHGKAGGLLGLSGEIKQAQWEALCDNRHPVTGGQLTRRQNKERTQGYDFNFHVPKSVSLLYADSLDCRILDAIREAADSTMEDVECEMAARVRKGGKQENRFTRNCVYGSFVHLSARPVGSIPDPHCHVHAFMHNLTFDHVEQQWKAGQFRGLKERAPHFEALFHARLKASLADLGLPIQRTKEGWELAGIDKAFIAKFSRRTEQIEVTAQLLGVHEASAKSELGAKTRERKQKNLTMPQLQAIWRSRMTIAERRALAALKARLGGTTESINDAPAGGRDNADSFIDDTLRRLAFYADWSRRVPLSDFRQAAREH
jgi:conjugative relaxase-like TrwC/TraI family protein